MTRGLVLATLRLHRAQIVVTAAFLVVLLAARGISGTDHVDGEQDET